MILQPCFTNPYQINTPPFFGDVGEITMITDIKEKLADMQAKYIDKQSAEDTLKKVDNRKTAKIKKKFS